MFPHGKGGILTTSERPLMIANRIRTRDCEIVITRLLPQDEATDSLNDICLLDTRGNHLSTRIPRETTFYVVATIKAGCHYLRGTVIAQVHPLLKDLGSWTEGPDWRPTWGPRFYPVNFHFEIGSARKRTLRTDEILALAAQGFPDKAIAQHLGIGLRTVETHWRILREKNGHASRTEAVAAFLQSLAERERENVEAQRDRIAAEAWLRESTPARHTSLSGSNKVLSWPMN